MNNDTVPTLLIIIQEGLKGIAIFFSLYVVWAVLNILGGS